MISKTKAVKFVDDWYKVVDECLKVLPSQRACAGCPYAKEVLFSVDVGSSMLVDEKKITSMDVCSTLYGIFKKLDR